MKTWLTALFCVVRCILFPKTKICIASATRPQANEVLQKITTDFMKNHEWGSDNLRREILDYSVGASKAEINFRNGSWIKVVTASDTGRGNRANVLVMDEFRMLDENTIKTVLKRFLGDPRHPNYLDKKEYKNDPKYLETNIEIYMSSCWYKQHWSYDKSKAYTVNLLGGREGYFVCALPYQMAIKEGLKKRIEIEDEMSEADFDEMTFNMEMGCIPIGSSDDAFFSFDDISIRRKLNLPVYKPGATSKNLKIPDLIENERRILSVDVALLASSGKSKNDASSIILNRAIPTSNNTYTGNIVYLENHEGITTDKLALIVRREFSAFECTDLVLDVNGVGIGVYDMLIKDIFDEETGVLYPALTCRNNKELAARCSVNDAKPVIWAINARSEFNNKICTLLRSGFKNGKLNLLVSEFEAEEILKEKVENFNKMLPFEQMILKMPYVQTTLLVYELISLGYEIRDKVIRIVEKNNMRKDRYSSLAYNYWVQTQLEIECLNKQQTKISPDDIKSQWKRLCKKPIMY